MKIKKLPLLFLFVFSEIFSLTAQQTPVALWDFNDSSTNDQSVNNFNAVVEVINYDKGVNCDTSALFNGKGNRISYGNIMDTLFTKGTFSISLWTNPSSYVDPDGDLSMLIQKWHTSGSSDNSFILYPKAFISSNGSVYFTPLPLNKWSHIAVSVDDGDVYIYIDGELAAMDTTTHHVFASTSYPLMIGSLHNTRYLLDGNIDEVAIYHKALTQSQVKDIMEANSFAHQYTADIEGVIGKDLTIGPDPKTGFSYNWNTGASESKITLKSSEPKTDTYTLEINNSTFGDIINT